jgi:ankyrin repeat protein
MNSNYLINAVKNNDEILVRELISSGANLESADNRGYTALLLASSKGYNNIVQILIDAGADINAIIHHVYISLYLYILYILDHVIVDNSNNNGSSIPSVATTDTVTIASWQFR